MIDYYLNNIWKSEMKFAIILPNTYILNGKEVTIKELLTNGKNQNNK